MSVPPSEEESRHLDAIARAVAAGFTRVQLATDAAAAAGLLVFERHRSGYVDVISMVGMREARAARWAAQDYGVPGAHPLWERMGSVCDVITAVLGLDPPARSCGEAGPAPPAGPEPG